MPNEYEKAKQAQEEAVREADRAARMAAQGRESVSPCNSTHLLLSVQIRVLELNHPHLHVGNSLLQCIDMCTVLQGAQPQDAQDANDAEDALDQRGGLGSSGASQGGAGLGSNKTTGAPLLPYICL